MRDAPQPQSLDLLSAEVRDQLSGQLRHLERLDGKAGFILGFAGLLVALAPPSATLWIDAARLAAIVSAVASLLSFLPAYHLVVDVRSFRDSNLTADAVSTRLELLDTYLVMLDRALAIGDQKSHRLMASLSVLVAAIILAFVGLAAT